MDDDKDITPFLPPVGKRLTLPLPRRASLIPPGECKACDEYRNYSMFPPHDASQNCESGKHPHCTCSTCF